MRLCEGLQWPKHRPLLEKRGITNMAAPLEFESRILPGSGIEAAGVGDALVTAAAVFGQVPALPGKGLPDGVSFGAAANEKEVWGCGSAWNAGFSGPYPT